MSQSGSGETGTGSIEVSVPTDLTVTSEGDTEDPRQHLKRHTREMYNLTAEKGHLQQTIEKLRLELQEKNAQLVSNKAQYSNLMNQKDLQTEMKLSEKQAKVNRLEAELLATSDELRLLKERAAKELAHLLQKCLEFQQNQARLMVKHDEIKSSLNNLTISDEEWSRIRNIPRDQLSLQQFVSLRVYDMVMPLNAKIKELESVKTSLRSAISTCEQDLETKRGENEKLAQEAKSLREKLTNVTLQVEELRSEMKSDDFRIHNFDRIKRERDKYEEERENFIKEKSDLELAFSVCSSERKVLEERVSELKTKLRQQEQELCKYKNDFFDARSQLEKGKENSQKTSSQLKLEQERSEGIHEKFLKARMDIISLSDSLQDSKSEVKLLKEKCVSSSQLEKITTNELNELQRRYTQLSDEMKHQQTKYVKEKDGLKLEISELRASYNSLSKTYNVLRETNSKLADENQTNQAALQAEKLTKEEEALKLKQESFNLKRQLDHYKALEDDYLSTLKVIASVPIEDEKEAGHRFPVSSIVEGKLSEETISLTRRILHLERQNIEACSTIQKFTSTLDQMRRNLASYKVAFASASRPSSQLLEKVRSQEEQIIVLEEALQACNESKIILSRDLKSLEKDLTDAKSFIEGNKMQREEVKSLKKEISDLQNWIEHNLNKGKGAIPKAIKITKGR